MFASLYLLGSTGFLSGFCVKLTSLSLVGYLVLHFVKEFVKFAAYNFVDVGHCNLLQELFVIIIFSECSFTQQQFCS